MNNMVVKSYPCMCCLSDKMLLSDYENRAQEDCENHAAVCQETQILQRILHEQLHIYRHNRTISYTQ